LLLLFTFDAYALCDDAIDQIGYRTCLAQKAESSQKEVEVKRIALLTKIKSWDQEPEFRGETIKLFEKAANSFESYKQHQCDYEWSAAAGGNGASSMAFHCVIKLNTEYLNSLETQLGWYEPY
jgi:hypothetical protein